MKQLAGRPKLVRAAVGVGIVSAAAGIVLAVWHPAAAGELSVQAGSPHGLAGAGSGVVVALYSKGQLVAIDGNGHIRFRTNLGRHPTNPVVVGHVAWVPVIGAAALVGVDTASGAIVHRYHGTYAAAVPGPDTSLLLATWVDAPADPKLWRGRNVARLDTSSGKVLWTRRLPGLVLSLASSGREAWVPDFASPRLSILDVQSGAVRRTVRLPQRAVSTAIGRTCGWLALADGRLLRLDAQTAKIRGSTTLAGANVDYMQVADGGVWVSSYDSPAASTLEHVSCKTGSITATIPTGGASQGLFVSSHYVWVANFDANVVVRLRKPTPR